MKYVQPDELLSGKGNEAKRKAVLNGLINCKPLTFGSWE